MSKVWCFRCGSKLAEGSRWCSWCGAQSLPWLLTTGPAHSGWACPLCSAGNTALASECEKCRTVRPQPELIGLAETNQRGGRIRFEAAWTGPDNPGAGGLSRLAQARHKSDDNLTSTLDSDWLNNLREEVDADIGPASPADRPGSLTFPPAAPAGPSLFNLPADKPDLFHPDDPMLKVKPDPTSEPSAFDAAPELIARPAPATSGSLFQEEPAARPVENQQAALAGETITGHQPIRLAPFVTDSGESRPEQPAGQLQSFLPDLPPPLTPMSGSKADWPAMPESHSFSFRQFLHETGQLPDIFGQQPGVIRPALPTNPPADSATDDDLPAWLNRQLTAEPEANDLPTVAGEIVRPATRSDLNPPAAPGDFADSKMNLPDGPAGRLIVPATFVLVEPSATTGNEIGAEPKSVPGPTDATGSLNRIEAVRPEPDRDTAGQAEGLSVQRTTGADDEELPGWLQSMMPGAALPFRMDEEENPRHLYTSVSAGMPPDENLPSRVPDWLQPAGPAAQAEAGTGERPDESPLTSQPAEDSPAVEAAAAENRLPDWLQLSPDKPDQSGGPGLAEEAVSITPTQAARYPGYAGQSDNALYEVKTGRSGSPDDDRHDWLSDINEPLNRPGQPETRLAEAEAPAWMRPAPDPDADPDWPGPAAPRSVLPPTLASAEILKNLLEETYAGRSEATVGRRRGDPTSNRRRWILSILLLAAALAALLFPLWLALPAQTSQILQGLGLLLLVVAAIVNFIWLVRRRHESAG